MKRQFAAEFKRSVVLELEGKTLTEVCLEHSLHLATVSGWRKDYEMNPQEAFKAHSNLKQFIEDVYNAKRLHSSIGYQPPDELEAEVLKIRLLTV